MFRWVLIVDKWGEYYYNLPFFNVPVNNVS